MSRIVEGAIMDILAYYKISLADENFKDTPYRTAKVYDEFLKGYSEEDIEKIMSKSFPSELREMTVVKDIPATTLCPHHLLPVLLRVTIGYIPNGRVLGLSKFNRLVKLIAKAPLLQEDLTKILADTINDYLKPFGVIVVVSGKHTCMIIRGIEQPDAEVTTSSVRGVFDDNHNIKMEFFKVWKNGNV